MRAVPRLARRPTAPRAPRGAGWTAAEATLLAGLRSPERIQAFLDDLAYRARGDARCPREVLAERRARCYDGALLGAAALRRLGHPPLLVDLRAVNDDDHVLAVFRVRGLWGAVAKSHFAGLRFREPVHRSLRELALTYFEAYYNAAREKTLREVSVPLDLRAYDALDWERRREAVPLVERRLDAIRHQQLLPRGAAARLSPVDRRSVRLGKLRD